VDVKERGVLERVAATESDVEAWLVGDRRDRHADELFQPGGRNFILPARMVANEAQFLERDVEEAVGVEADERVRAQAGTEAIEVRLENGSRYPDHADRVHAVVVTPIVGVVPSICTR
jgi:hypothetical protein